MSFDTLIRASRQDDGKLAIAIDGAQSTGKTTLFNHLRTVFQRRATFIPEASRMIAERFGVLTASDWPRLLAEPIRLQEFFEAEEAWQSSAEAAGSPFIVDSSLYLIRTYREYFQIPPRNGEWPHVSYNLILYCPLGATATEDGFRFLEGRSEVDRIYRSILKMHHHGQVLELPTGGSRLPLAQNSVHQCLQQHSQLTPVDHGSF